MKLTIATDELDFAQKPTLNKDFWQDEKLNPEVRKVILAIVKNYLKSTNLEINIDDIDEIEFTGSLANYNHNKFSDVDIHLLFDFSKLGKDPDFMRELLVAKAINWNDRHNVTIFGHEVELYITDAGTDHHSTGVYSVKNDEWLVKPVRDPKLSAELNLNKVKDKADKISKKIDMLVVKDDLSYDALEVLKDKIKKMREAGLETGGEYSTENLAFKLLRRRGELNTLYTLMNQAQDAELSLDEDMEWWKKRRSLDNKNYRELMGHVGKKSNFKRKYAGKNTGYPKSISRKKLSKMGPPYNMDPPMKLPKSGPPGVGALEEEVETIARKIKLPNSTSFDKLFNEYINKGIPVIVNFFADSKKRGGIPCLDEHSYLIQNIKGGDKYSVNLMQDIKTIIDPVVQSDFNAGDLNPTKCLYLQVGRENTEFAVRSMLGDAKDAGQIIDYEVTVYETREIRPTVVVKDEPIKTAPTQSLFARKVKKEKDLVRLLLVAKKDVYFTNLPDFAAIFKTLYDKAVKAAEKDGKIDFFDPQTYVRFFKTAFNPITIYRTIEDMAPKGGYGYVYYDPEGSIKKYLVRMYADGRAETQTENLTGRLRSTIASEVESSLDEVPATNPVEKAAKKAIKRIALSIIKDLKTEKLIGTFSKEEWVAKIDEATDLKFCSHFDCKRSTIMVSKPGKKVKPISIEQYLRGGTFAEIPPSAAVFITQIELSDPDEKFAFDKIWADNANNNSYLDIDKETGIVDTGLKNALLALISTKYKLPEKQKQILIQQVESLAGKSIVSTEDNLQTMINNKYRSKCGSLREMKPEKRVSTILADPEIKPYIPWFKKDQRKGKSDITIECDDGKTLTIGVPRSNYRGNIEDTGLLFKTKIGDTQFPLEAIALKKLLNDFGLKYGFKKYDAEDTWFMPREVAEQWRTFNPNKDYSQLDKKQIDAYFSFPDDVKAENFNKVTTAKIRVELIKLAKAARDVFGNNAKIAITEAMKTKGHVGKSQHITGNAVDFYIDNITGKSKEEVWEKTYCFTLAAMAADVIDKGGLGVYFKKGGKVLSDKPHYDTRGSNMAWKWVSGKKIKSTSATKNAIIDKNILDLPKNFIKRAKDYRAALSGRNIAA